MTFKIALMSTALCLGLTSNPTTAHAEDWSGLYIGGQLGWHQFLFEDTNIASTSPFAGQLKENSFAGGLYSGYNFQSGNFIYGLEADVSFNNASFDFSVSQGAEYVKLSLHQKSAASLRARFGFSQSNYLLYGTAGLAFTQLNIDLDIKTNTLTRKETLSKKRIGLALGLGLENKLSDSLVLRAEYLYSDFGDISKEGFKPIEFSSHDLKLGIAYKF